MTNTIPAGRRIELLDQLGSYLRSDASDWQLAIDRAVIANGWFTRQHILTATDALCSEMLRAGKLHNWLEQYTLPAQSRKVGIIMAGNIPMVGFHDFLCGFVAGHQLWLKPSSKDDVLLRFAIEKLTEWEPGVAQWVRFEERLNGCDAYIATGSNNTSRYFEQYFGKYPHIIRKNRTSVAVLQGDETDAELNLLADDVYQYFGLGCRNVTQVAVPRGYDFNRMLGQFDRYEDYINHNKYKNNYDYHLALYLLNRVPYLASTSLLLVENELPFSAVSVLHYRYYDDRHQIEKELKEREDIQVVVGRGLQPFGASQKPGLNDFADGVNTMEFLCGL